MHSKEKALPLYMTQSENIYISRIRNKHVRKRDDEYPFTIPVIRNLKEFSFDKSVTYIVGANGSGKSTLLEAIAVLLRLNPEGGSRNFNFKTVETHSLLFKDLVMSRADLTYKDAFFFRAESYYNVASEIDRLSEEDISLLKYYGGKSIHERSHGEGFMALINNRIRGKGIYIFDEPEAALSFDNQLAFLCWMKIAIQAGAQIIIATHSPVILSYPDACIYEIEDDNLKKKKYEETEIYRSTYSFILNRELYLHKMGLI